jgi:hypothetical protein
MNPSEANTAFAVIANWRGQSLDDGERAAWKNQLIRMEWDEFNEAIETWGRSSKAHLRPSLSDLWALTPNHESKAKVPDYVPRNFDAWNGDPESLPAIERARESLFRAKGKAGVPVPEGEPVEAEAS